MEFYAVQNAFNGGELDPLVLARVDLPRYQTGAQLLENFVPTPQGAVMRRPGTQYMGPVKDLDAEKGHVGIYPFIFSEKQGRVLEIGDKYMRVWLDTGGLVLKDDEIYEITLPYEGEHVSELSIAQSADVLYIAHKSYPPAKISRYDDDDWVYEELTFLPTIEPPTSLTLTAMGSVPGSGSKTYSYQVTTISADSGDESSPTEAYTIYTDALSQTYYIRIEWPAVENALQYRVYKKYGGTHCFMGITDELYFDDVNSEVDTGDTPPQWENPFDGEGNWPSIAFFYQQRLGYASTDNQPMTLFMSKSAAFENFSSSTTLASDDAIEVTLATKKANAIKWLEPSTYALVMGTNGEEYTVGPASGSVLSPLDISFEQQTSSGSADFAAIPIESGVLFVQRGANAIKQIAYNYSIDKMLSQDLSLLAPHILRDYELEGWTYQQIPHSVVWTVLSDGTLAGLTIMQEHDVVGWHRHNTQGTFEAVTVIPGNPEDQVWFLVRRENGLYIERFSQFFVDSPEEYVFVDSSLTYQGDAVSTLYGMGHLEGQTVTAFADGATTPETQIEDGYVTIPQASETITVGLPYTSVMQPTMPETQIQNGHSLMTLRRIIRANVQIYKSMAFEFSMDNENWYSMGDRIIGENMEYMPDFWEKATVSIAIGGGLDLGQVYYASRAAAPLTILAIGTVLDISSEQGGN